MVIKFLYIIMYNAEYWFCGWCFACMYVCAAYAGSVWREEKRALRPLELEFQVVISSHVGAENRTQLLCESKQCAQPLSRLCSLSFLLVMGGFHVKTSYSQGNTESLLRLKWSTIPHNYKCFLALSLTVTDGLHSLSTAEADMLANCYQILSLRNCSEC